MNDKLVLSRYIESTTTKYRNKKELCERLARIFKLERSYVWCIVSILIWEYPELFPAKKKHKTQHAEKQKRCSSGFRRLSHSDKGLIVFKPKTKVVHAPRYIKSDGVAKEKSSLKDAKPFDGMGSVWKKGKIEPVIQKNYRGSFQDKD